MTEAPLGDDPAIHIDQEVEDTLERFDAAWQDGRKPLIQHYLPPGEPTESQAGFRRRLLEELIKVDLEYRWRRRRQAKATERGTTLKDKLRIEVRRRMPTRPHLEDYVRQFPELGSLEDLPLDVIAEEYRVRRRWGDKPEQELYLARFPNRDAELLAALNTVDEELARIPADETTISRSDVRLADESTPAPARRARREKMPARIGRYKIRKELGRGAFGAVYLAFDEELERQVAIKVPRDERLLRKPKDMQAIFREARLAAQLRHPALVEVYDVGREESGRCYIVMEYIEGQPLGQLMRAQRIERAQAAQWILRIAEAVHCAHKVGLVHADLKPGNILIDLENHPHVADFGLAVSESDQRRLARSVAGTPAYMSPEQVRGESHRVDGRSDLWSLGAIFYEMLTGRMPFSGDSVDEIFDEIQFRDPKPPRQIDDAIEPQFEEICLRCLSKQVTQRYTTATDLARDLMHALETQSLGAASVQGSQRYFAGESSSVRQARAAGLPLGSRRAPQTNLPSPTTSFIGREREIGELIRLVLNPSAWLVTVLGPGGIGKTRLAQRVGRDLLDQFSGGCWFAEVESARTVSAVAHAVAHAFGVPLTGSEPAEQVVANVLEYRKPLVLILDNFEQAVEHARATVGLWQQRAPHVRFLVTSRSPLGLTGEREYELGPLTAPLENPQRVPRVEELVLFDSVKLFRDRASEVDASFQIDEGNAQAIAQICRGLEGIPLAVELAAARVKILKPEQMAQMLGQKFRLLQSPRRDLPARQKTLEGAIDWSYSLLGDWEQQAVMQCSIFQGGFSWEAAEQVIDLTAFPHAPLTLDVIQSLREKSLVTRQDTPHQARFGMYVSIREYAEQKWRQSATPLAQQQLGERFARAMIQYAETWNARLHTAAVGEALDRLQAEMLNLFAVQDWALDSHQPETAARAVLAAAQTMAVRGPADRRVSRLERSLTALPESAVELRVSLMVALSDACQAVGIWDRAVALADQAVELSQSMGPVKLRGMALVQQGEMRRYRGDGEAAYTCFVQSESIYRQLDDRQGLARSLAGRGMVLWQRGDSEQALRCYDEATSLAEDSHDQIGIATVSRHRGHVLWQRGDYNGALKCYAEAERIARELGDERTIHLTIGNRGIVLADQGDYDGALQCYSDAEAIARKLGDKRGIAMNVGNRGIALSDRGDPNAALGCYREAEAINREIQTKFGTAVNIGNRGNALADLGDYDAALASFDEAEAMNREMGNKFLLALNIGDRGACWLKMGQRAKARDALRSALSLLDELGTRHSPEYFAYQSLQSQCEQALGNPVVAAILANEALHLASQLGFGEGHPKLRTRGHLAVLREIVSTSDTALSDDPSG